MEQLQCIRPDVRPCGVGRYHSLTVRFTISGRDGQARVNRIDARTAPELESDRREGDGPAQRPPPVPADAETLHCVERAFARMRFAPFSKESLEIAAPFSTL